MTPAQIKFRGFRTDGKGWVEGDLVKWKSRNLYAVLPQEGDQWNNPFDFTIHPESLGMFTGETDKNGREIFGAIGERGGDVVKYIGGKKERGKPRGFVTSFVIYKRGMFTVDNNQSIVHDFAILPLCEIIGNQWEDK